MHLSVSVGSGRLFEKRLPCVGELNDGRGRFGGVLSVPRVVKFDTKFADGLLVSTAARLSRPTSSDSELQQSGGAVGT